MSKSDQKGLVSAVNVAMTVQDSRSKPKPKPTENYKERQARKAEMLKLYLGKVDYIINRLKASCKHWQLSWTNSVEQQVRQQMCEEMLKMGIDPEFKGNDAPILDALKEIEKSKIAYVPSVAEFFDVVRRHQVGNPKFPVAQHAYQEACMKSYDTPIEKWSHVAVYYAASETGWYDLRTKEEKLVFPVFKEKYAEIIQRVLNGEQLSTPRVMIEQQKTEESPKSDKKTAIKHLEALKAGILEDAAE